MPTARMPATLNTPSHEMAATFSMGSQPQLMLAKTSGIEVNVPSTIRPDESTTSLASCTAIAPPSEWP